MIHTRITWNCLVGFYILFLLLSIFIIITYCLETWRCGIIWVKTSSTGTYSVTLSKRDYTYNVFFSLAETY